MGREAFRLLSDMELRLTVTANFVFETYVLKIVTAGQGELANTGSHNLKELFCYLKFHFTFDMKDSKSDQKELFNPDWLRSFPDLGSLSDEEALQICNSLYEFAQLLLIHRDASIDLQQSGTNILLSNEHLLKKNSA